MVVRIHIKGQLKAARPFQGAAENLARFSCAGPFNDKINDGKRNRLARTPNFRIEDFRPRPQFLLRQVCLTRPIAIKLSQPVLPRVERGGGGSEMAQHDDTIFLMPDFRPLLDDILLMKTFQAERDEEGIKTVFEFNPRERDVGVNHLGFLPDELQIGGGIAVGMRRCQGRFPDIAVAEWRIKFGGPVVCLRLSYRPSDAPITLLIQAAIGTHDEREDRLRCGNGDGWRGRLGVNGAADPADQAGGEQA